MRLTRSERYGPNEIKETSRRGPLRIFVSQFADYIIAAVAEGRRIFDDIRKSIKDTIKLTGCLFASQIFANSFSRFLDKIFVHLVGHHGHDLLAQIIP